jgi:hypothetical protein
MNEKLTRSEAIARMMHPHWCGAGGAVRDALCAPLTVADAMQVPGMADLMERAVRWLRLAIDEGEDEPGDIDALAPFLTAMKGGQDAK